MLRHLLLPATPRCRAVKDAAACAIRCHPLTIRYRNFQGAQQRRSIRTGEIIGAVFGLHFFKAQPPEYIIKYSGGRVVRSGAGIAFYYLEYNTQIVAVQTSSQDASFVFNETTRNFQDVTLQGQFTYRIA